MKRCGKAMAMVVHLLTTFLARVCRIEILSEEAKGWGICDPGGLSLPVIFGRRVAGLDLLPLQREQVVVSTSYVQGQASCVQDQPS